MTHSMSQLFFYSNKIHYELFGLFFVFWDFLSMKEQVNIQSIQSDDDDDDKDEKGAIDMSLVIVCCINVTNENEYLSELQGVLDFDFFSSLMF